MKWPWQGSKAPAPRDLVVVGSEWRPIKQQGSIVREARWTCLLDMDTGETVFKPTYTSWLQDTQITRLRALRALEAELPPVLPEDE